MEAIANITAVNGWALAAWGFASVFLALFILFTLISLLMKYTNGGDKSKEAPALKIPKGMKVLGKDSYTNSAGDEALSEEYKAFLASLKR